MFLHRAIEKNDKLTIKLFFVFSALLTFRFFYLRVSYWSLHHTALPEFSMPIFLPYYLAMTLGVVASIYLLKHSKDEFNLRLYILILVIPVVCAALSIFSSGMSKLLFMFFGFMLNSVSISMCMYLIAMQVDFSVMGRFTTICFAVMNIIGSLALSLQDYHQFIQLGLLGMLTIVAVIAILINPTYKAINDTEMKLEPMPVKRIVCGVIVILCLYSFVAGVLYNLYFIKESLDQSGLFFVTLISSSAIYIVVGYLIDKIKWHITAIFLFMVIVTGQIMSYSIYESVLALPFAYITLAGFIAMDAVTITIPLYYAKKIKKFYLAGLGYALLYGGMFATTFLHKYATDSIEKTIFAMMLAASPFAMLLIFFVSTEYAKQRSEFILKNVTAITESNLQLEFLTDEEREILTRHLDQKENLEKISLSPIEKEIAALLCEHFTQRDICRKLRLTASEVNNHLISIRGKVAKPQVDANEALINAIVKDFHLTKRETEMLAALCNNETNPEIAASLFLSESTIKFHVSNLLKKIPVNKRVEVADWVKNYNSKDMG